MSEIENYEECAFEEAFSEGCWQLNGESDC